MAIIYESNLALYPLKSILPSNNNPGIRLGDIIKGSLTSVTDTYDDYNIIINKKTFVNLKFNVEQAVNEYDFYYLRTPVGVFYVHPLYPKFPSEGINFYITNNTSYAGFIYYDSIDVNGSNMGVFKLGYTLEITELNENLAGNLIEAGPSFEKSPSIRVNQTISVWDGYDSRGNLANYLKLIVPTLPQGVSGTLGVRLMEVQDYDNKPNSIPKITMDVYNEGKRFIGGVIYDNIKTAFVVNNIMSGEYYLRFDSNSDIPMLSKYEIGFYEVFSNTKTVAHNSNLDDYFSNWSTRLDAVVYADSISNYQIESPRVLRRLQTLRRLSHEQEIKSFFTGDA